MVSDGSADLKGKVVSALKYAAEPSLADCQLTMKHVGFDAPLIKEQELFRNQLQVHSFLLPESALESIALNFKASLNPLTGKAMDINIT